MGSNGVISEGSMRGSDGGRVMEGAEGEGAKVSMIDGGCSKFVMAWSWANDGEGGSEISDCSELEEML